MNVMALLEALADELSRGAPVPLTSKRMVDADKCLDIISELRVNLPDDVRDAAVIMQKRDSILDDADAQAADIIEEAERRFEQLVSQHAITREAEMRAQEILAMAKKEAKEMHAASVIYAEDLFAEMERRVQDMLADVRKNRQDLHSMR